MKVKNSCTPFNDKALRARSRIGNSGIQAKAGNLPTCVFNVIVACVRLWHGI